MMHLRQSSASQSVLIGPFVDSSDGNTVEDGLSIANTDIRLSKNGGNLAAKNSGGGTHDELGYYTITLDATDTNTVGRLQLCVHMSGALPVYHEFEVLEEVLYDAIYAASAARIPADVTHISGAVVNTGSAQLGVNVVNAAGTAWNSGAIGANTLAGDTITAAKIAADAIGASELAADAVTEIQSGLATAAALATVDGNVDLILEDTATTLPGILGTPVSSVSDDIAAVQSAVDGLNDLSSGDVETAVGTALATYDPPTRTELTSDIDSVLTAIGGLENLSAAAVNAEVDTALADIHLDHLFAATYDPASKPGAADALLNELIENDGGVSRFTANALEQAPSGGLDAAGIRDAVGLASADLDTQLSTIDGNVDSILADTGTDGVVVSSIATDAVSADALAAGAVSEIQSGLATAASISALNNLSAAQVNAQVVDALATDTYAEPGQGAPGATLSLAAKINYLYKAWRNRQTQTADTYRLYNDDGTTAGQAATVSDDGSTFERGEIGTGA